jgi:hypothetical protein
MIINSRLFVWLDFISYLLNCCQSELCVIKCFRRWLKLLIRGSIEVEMLGEHEICKIIHFTSHSFICECSFHQLLSWDRQL